MYEDVLVPTDGSDAVDDALEHGLRLAENEGAAVHGLYVIDQRITGAAGTDAREDVEETLAEEGERALSAVAEAAERRGLSVTTERRQGTPYKEILEYVDEAHVDLIAIASHGKSPREKLTSLGSVSERVVDAADVPVLVVRADEAPAED